VVVVAPGVYVEGDLVQGFLTFKGKAITVASSGGPQVTTLQPLDPGSSVVVFQDGEGLDSILQGFTIMGGSGGVACLGSSPTVLGNVISGNSGAGVRLELSSAHLRRNVIRHNQAFLEGGGVYCFYSSPCVEDTVVYQNEAGFRGAGMMLVGNSNPLLANVTVVDNSTDVLQNGTQGGGLCLIGGASATIRNSILWGNTADQGSQIQQDFQPVDVQYSVVEGGWPGLGNISENPQFVDRPAGNLALQSTSPCLDAGDPGEVPARPDLAGTPRYLDGDLDGSLRVDLGAYEFSHIRLIAGGSFTPGGNVVVQILGTAGLPVFLFAGTAPGTAFLPPFGHLFLDAGAPFFLLPWQPIPSTTPAVVPATIPPGTRVVLQGVALSNGSGNLSNAIDRVID
jgi:hypothetical protein